MSSSEQIFKEEFPMHEASVDSLYRLDPRTRDLLIESAPLMEAWSATHCGRKDTGGMEEWAKNQGLAETQPVASCGWYHGTWQYLRLLNMVAVPPWYEFYNEALSNVLRQHPNADVFISAAADYGMLATLHEAIQTAGASPNIVLYDICQTPIRACQWYAERHGLSLKCVCDNLLTCDIPKASFDLIVTDEFLTVIKAEDKPQIVKRWRELLKPGGTLVTTAMLGGPTTPELRTNYAERARRKFAENVESFPTYANGRGAELQKRFDTFASVHTRHMLKDEDELRRLFEGFGTFSYVKTITPGECVNPTYSCQIVASVP
jgi:2-polyprenyl-3-methyl-5-hydroxy-6-metoxy-1,4-benzoquinol methylase